MKTQLDWKKFSPLFGTWWPKIEPFFLSGGFDPIYAHLRKQSQSGKQICPASMNTYRTFKETDYNELKCVILCTEPYNKIIDGSPIASGIPLDNSLSARNQPDLIQFYKGIEKELFNGLNLEYIEAYDLTYLSQQGVLLLYCALTVEENTPNSHLKIWKPFITFLLKEVISTTGVPILFLGEEAVKFKPIIQSTNPFFTTTEPKITATGETWDTQKAFRGIGDCIWNTNEDTISWLYEPPF